MEFTLISEKAYGTVDYVNRGKNLVKLILGDLIGERKRSMNLATWYNGENSDD